MKSPIRKTSMISLLVAAMLVFAGCATFSGNGEPPPPSAIVQDAYTALALLQDSYMAAGGAVKSLEASGKLNEAELRDWKLVEISTQEVGLAGKAALLSYWDNPTADTLIHVNRVRSRLIAAAAKISVRIATAEDVPPVMDKEYVEGPITREMIEAIEFPPWSEL